MVCFTPCKIGKFTYASKELGTPQKMKKHHPTMVYPISTFYLSRLSYFPILSQRMVDAVARQTRESESLNILFKETLFSFVETFPFDCREHVACESAGIFKVPVELKEIDKHIQNIFHKYPEYI